MAPRGSVFSRHWYLLAVCGLGFYFACTEAYRFTTLNPLATKGLSAILVSVAIILITGAVLLPMSAKHLKLYENKAFIIIATLCFTFDLFMRLVGIPGISDSTRVLISQLVKPAEYVLCLAFAEFFLALRPQLAAKAVGEALIIAGVVQLCAGMLTRSAAIAMVLLFCLCAGPLLLMASAGWGSWSSPTAYGGLYPEDDQEIVEVQTDDVAFRTLCISMFLLPFIFGSVHFHWVPLQDGGTTSLLIQIAAACGTILAGNLILLIRKSIRSASFVDFCKDLILPVALGALYLSTFLEGGFSGAYIVLLNIAQKFALFLIWIAPFFYVIKRPPLQMFTALYLCYVLGRALLSVLNYLYPRVNGEPSLVFSLLIGAAMVILVIVAVFSRFNARNQVEEEAVPEIVPAVDPQSTGYKKRFQRACRDLATANKLTPRETEVFMMLAKGHSADVIARDMKVGVPTVRTHINHVYQKLGTSSQSMLMDLVEEKAESEEMAEE